MASVVVRNLMRQSRPAAIAMVHVRPLPGTPNGSQSVKKITEIALQETDVYANAGVDGIIVENMHDLPYLIGHNIGPEITASMATICYTVKSEFPEMPIGVQVLKAGNMQALGVANAAGCDFVRVECFTFAHVSDAGWVNATAGELHRYRKQIGAGNVSIFTDIKKKHSSHSVTADQSITEAAEAAEFFQSDGVIVTGNKTGQAASVTELQDVCSKVNIPVLIGSGVTTENLENYMKANGLIVGSYFKRGGLWSNDICSAKVTAFMEKLIQLSS